MKVRTFDIALRSLIYRRNSSGPKTEPWGTPHVTEDQILCHQHTHIGVY